MFGLGLGLGLSASRATSTPTFDPATLNLNVYLGPDFAASPWVGLASAGTSENNDGTEATNPPASFTISGDYKAADFDGTNDLLATDDFSEVCLPKAGYGLAVLFYCDTAAAASANVYDDPGLVGDGYGLNIAFSDGGFGVAHFNGAWKQQRVACSAGAWHLGKVRFDTATGIEFGVDGDALTAIATSTGDRVVTSSTYKLIIGRAIVNALKTFDGKIGAVFCASTLSDDDFDDIRTFCNAIPGVSV